MPRGEETLACGRVVIVHGGPLVRAGAKKGRCQGSLGSEFAGHELSNVPYLEISVSLPLPASTGFLNLKTRALMFRRVTYHVVSHRLLL